MVSKYDVRWKRVKAGRYVMLPSGNYRIQNVGNGWMVYYYNLMTGKEEPILGCSTYAEAKVYAEKHKDALIDKAIKGFGRR